MRRPFWMLVIVVAAAMVALTQDAFAGFGPNTIPFSDDFEAYPTNTPLINGTNGWYGSSSNIIVVSNLAIAPVGSTNIAMIPVDCTLSNRFTNIVPSNVWIQMDLRPNLYPGLFDVTNNPVVDTNQAGVFFVNSNGYFVVHHGVPSPNATNSTNWVLVTNGGIVTNGTNWVSVQIEANYANHTWALYADDILVTNNIGFVNPNLNNFTVFDVYNGGLSTSYIDNVSVVTPAVIKFDPLVLAPELIRGELTNSTVLVWYEGMGVVDYTVTTNRSWLTLSQTGGSLTGQTVNATNTIVVTCNTAGLTVGGYTGTVTFASTNSGGSTNTLTVTLTVRAAPMLNVSPTLITNMVMAGQNLDAQTLRIWNGSADDPIGYQVTTNATWLSVPVTTSYLAPLTTNILPINYAVSSLTSAGDVPSNYSGTITVTATNIASGSPVTIPVTVKVNPKPRMALSLTNLSQTVLQGQDATSQGFEVWNANGFYTLTYAVSKGFTPWLVLTQTSVGQRAQINVQYSTANLPAGLTNAAITVVGWAWDGVHASCAVETQTVGVALAVTPFATLTNNAQSGYQYTVRKGVTPPDTVFSIWNEGAPPNTMYFTVSLSASWLSVTPASGTSAGTSDKVPVRVQADPTGMRPGVVYSGTVRIDATDEGSGKPAYGSPQAFTITVVLRNFKGFDFQGDLSLSSASDLVLYREASGMWEIRNLLSNYASTRFLGGAGYQAVPGDYTGDGITEMGAYRPASGSWYAQQVDEESARVIEMQQWAGAEYVGMPGDYDGDGKTDPCVYLETSGLWMMLMSASGYQQASGIFGGPGYTALLAGDYDGDCIMDPAVYHRSSGLWVMFLSTSQSILSGIFGGDGFVPVPTDYDGDFLTDPAVYATESGYWYILPSTTFTSQGYRLLTPIPQFGGTAMSATLVPAPGNYDGVGGADLGLYDTATWSWYIMTLDGVPLAWGYPMGRLGCLPVLP
ncbi:MAG: hypothetical protein NT011_09595 [Kiritimatiellaeota bacterium]|nr:hypothetical protein [Kiritimatiellota bacterium]